MTKKARLFFMFCTMLAASAFIGSAPAQAGARVDCVYHWVEDQCAYMRTARPRPYRPHSDTCVHFPFMRGRAGPIDFFALNFRFVAPPTWMNKQQAWAFIASQTARAYFRDHKITAPEDDFCEVVSKVGHPVSVVFCDQDGFGYLRGVTLEATLQDRRPPNGLRVPLYGLHYAPALATGPALSSQTPIPLAPPGHGLGLSYSR